MHTYVTDVLPNVCDAPFLSFLFFFL